MAKVFITGISGFIGRSIAKQAVDLGYDVSGADRAGSNVAGIKVVRADIRDKNAMLRLTKNVDYVIHIAAVTSNLEFEKRINYCYDVNVNGFNSVIDAAYQNGCERFLYASSSAIYGNKFSEDTALDINGQKKNHYAKTKMINEMVAESYNDLGALETVGMRFFNVYGPGESQKGNYASIITLFIRQMLKNGQIVIYGNGKQSRDLIYVGDVAKIALKLTKKGMPGIYNVGTGKATSYNDIADMVSKGKKIHVKNPLRSYQLLTKADTKKLIGAIGNFKFMDVRSGAKEMVREAGL